MDPIVAGALIGTAGQFLGATNANSANADQARNQMAFQERMSSTAHQREVADLRAAGLNPILSANSGASTPNGAQANIQNAAEGLGASAREIGMISSQKAAIQAQIGLAEAQRRQADMNAVATATTMDKTKAETQLIQQNTTMKGTINKGLDIVKPWLPKIKEGTDAIHNLIYPRR